MMRKELQQQNGARGRIRTCTGDLLRVVSLLLDYASEKWNLWGASVWMNTVEFGRRIRQLQSTTNPLCSSFYCQSVWITAPGGIQW